MRRIRRYPYPRLPSNVFLHLQCVYLMDIITLNYISNYTYACSTSIILRIDPMYINRLSCRCIWYILMNEAACQCVLDCLTDNNMPILLGYLVTLAYEDAGYVIKKIMDTYTLTADNIRYVHITIKSVNRGMSAFTRSNVSAFLTHPQLWG